MSLLIHATFISEPIEKRLEMCGDFQIMYSLHLKMNYRCVFNDHMLILRGLQDESSTLYSYMNTCWNRWWWPCWEREINCFCTSVTTKKQRCEGCMAPKGSLHCSNLTRAWFVLLKGHVKTTSQSEEHWERKATFS